MEPTEGPNLLLGSLAVILLVAANAFFVAAEFGLVAARRTRLEGMARRGDRGAAAARRTLLHLDRYISATQLGITFTSLGLGWIGEPIVAGAINGLFRQLPAPLDVVATHAWAGTIAFFLITFLHIVLGELTPKALALLHPEETASWVAFPLIGFTVATNPFIWVLNGAANGLLRLLGARAPTERERVHSPEELLMLVEQSERSGTLESATASAIERVFEFTEKVAVDVMTPRTEMVTLRADLSVADAAGVIAEAGRSRYPVWRDSIDDVVGVVHAREVLLALRQTPSLAVSALMHPPLVVPRDREVEDVLTDMKRNKQHLAIVLDEYGGTAGLVTLEDVLEELVGAIDDEHDRPAEIAAEPGTLPGRTPVGEVNERLGLELDDEGYHTIGGFVFGRIGRLPAVGDRVEVDGGTFEVVAMRGRRVSLVRFTPGGGPHAGAAG